MPFLLWFSGSKAVWEPGRPSSRIWSVSSWCHQQLCCPGCSVWFYGSVPYSSWGKSDDCFMLWSLRVSEKRKVFVTDFCISIWLIWYIYIVELRSMNWQNAFYILFPISRATRHSAMIIHLWKRLGVASRVLLHVGWEQGAQAVEVVARTVATTW